MDIYNGKTIYTADDEEPDCELCDHLCDESDDLCVNGCGSEHGWYGYVRTVIESRMNDGKQDICPVSEMWF